MARLTDIQKQKIFSIESSIIEKYVGRVRYIETREDINLSCVDVLFSVRIPNADPLEMYCRLDKALEVICWGEVKNE